MLVDRALATVSSAVATAEMICHAVAALDLAGRPLYVLHSSEVPERLRHPFAWGHTHGCLDLWLEETLAAAGRWQGRGMAIVVSREPSDRDFVGTALHELAHRLQCPYHWPERTEFPDFAKLLTTGPTEPPAESSRLPPAGGDFTQAPWFMHGASFIRVCIHLAYRARLYGLRLYARDLFCAGDEYGLSPATSYETALGDEPREHVDSSLVELSEIALPTAFAKLWNRDTKNGELTL